ncbi:SynChlorMet cassette protein ScmD [candidate division WOR-1 bacterium RIFOXYB2_FULL_42_35]|uniref:SynChlorMet cassette protein ScmD n=1 Tax=candidate division WOR-1 bacterium RIFOXYC2_FULL_41_25 TaxID=1802586 RepID=A0A1F4TP78_UNCSA|nr:MAG: SynChlorMet cassette protein ScmD [candidate division WOR-1 bacterium RIFOXYA2_FULL_41_14]OGC25113.1 MAG: SynChlorMet cassette protein ScmD [candidate division WOR-1 bacterium RIFOXYB2_FULL_42_35]OGC34514.1 MAG: SynChlorMet cassette protein ScmD [candidate division WOR-1 bacterium RIFOXYC2_FULL_41_25]OGC43353.1 MAG: SynChlorMet cassette protein ScmD [candidate division WOR-1 bacterium RIFOXYD2_FULL_41_8]
MSDNKNPIANPIMVLREEFDDWAVVFNPDTGQAFGLNPTSVFIWKQLDGKNSIAEIVNMVKENCNNVPAEAEEHVNKFIEQLTEQGLVGYEAAKV